MTARRQVCAPMQDEPGRAGRLRAVSRPTQGRKKAAGGVLTVDWRGSAAQPGGRRSARSPHRDGGAGAPWRRLETERGAGLGRLRAGGPRARRPITGRLTRTRQSGSRRPTFAAGRSADRWRAPRTERESGLHAPAAVLERLTKKLGSEG